MIIEFCGVPGGGKSTAAAAYQSAHPEAVLITLDMHRRLPTAFFASLFALRHPLSFISLMRFAYRHHMRGLLLFSIHLALRACAKYEKASRRTGEALVDEGLVHAVMTLPAQPLEPAVVDWMLGRLPLLGVARVARSGTFHRFHGPRDAAHPRALSGEEALRGWERAVRANVAAAAERLPALGVAVTDIAS